MRARRWSAAVVGVLATCAAAAGCGAGPGSATPPHAAPPRSPGGGWSHAAAARCGDLVRVGRGVTVPPWRLGAIDFLSPRLGLALTATQVPCYFGPGQGIGFPRQQVRLAVSSDGGRRWVTQGRVVPARGPDPGFEQVVAVSLRRVWALTDGGHLLESRNGGGRWTPQPLPVPVADIARAGATLWALACPRPTPSWCRPVVERLASPQAAWQRLPVPPLRAGSYRLLDAVSARAAVFLVSRPGSARAELASTSDAGLQWAVRPTPRGPRVTRGRRACDIYAGITNAGPERWWLMCNGSGAGGSSPKALMATTDAGRSWRTIAVVPSILSTPEPGSLPWQEVLTIVAGSASRLWLATANEMMQSTDGGVIWARIRAANPQGALSSFDVLSPHRAWVLAPGASLWGTSNGMRWHRIGASWPGLP